MNTRVLLFFCLLLFSSLSVAGEREKAIVKNYADIAHAIYGDALIAAKEMQADIEAFRKRPSTKKLEQARESWKAARIPFLQADVFRFAHSFVGDWYRRVNAWPLDEGLIDYVADSYSHRPGNRLGALNIIASESITIDGEAIDLNDINAELLQQLHLSSAYTSNITMGFHAIEFLLWGQDSPDVGSGNRQYTDYKYREVCTNRNCRRRSAYLSVVTELLIRDLEYMAGQWAEGDDENFRSQLLKNDSKLVVHGILYGMGELALNDIANKSIQQPLLTHADELEQDDFSDNTHNSIYYSVLGIENIYFGSYTRSDGTIIDGPALAKLVSVKNPALAQKTEQAFQDTRKALQDFKQITDQPENAIMFDQMIANEQREMTSQGRRSLEHLVDALQNTSNAIESVMVLFGFTQMHPGNGLSKAY